MPAWFMIEPAQMKNGTASSGNESVACTNFCTKMRSGRPSAKMKNDSAAIAMREGDRHVEREQHEHQERGQEFHGSEHARQRVGRADRARRRAGRSSVASAVR